MTLRELVNTVRAAVVEHLDEDRARKVDAGFDSEPGGGPPSYLGEESRNVEALMGMFKQRGRR